MPHFFREPCAPINQSFAREVLKHASKGMACFKYKHGLHYFKIIHAGRKISIPTQKLRMVLAKQVSFDLDKLSKDTIAYQTVTDFLARLLSASMLLSCASKNSSLQTPEDFFSLLDKQLVPGVWKWPGAPVTPGVFFSLRDCLGTALRWTEKPGAA